MITRSAAGMTMRAIGGEDVCVPFMVSTQGYGLVWDNPSKTTVDLGFNGQNVWSSEVGDRVSYFVIAGDTSDEIYQGYRLLTGVTHMLPRAVYGYIQSKAIYPTQQQTLDVAKEYRERKLPLDVIVVDFLNMTKQGELDLDPKRWPDPAAMNRELHAMDVNTLLSVWPHFSQGTQFYDMLLEQRLAGAYARRKAGSGRLQRCHRAEYRHDESRRGQVVLGENSRPLRETVRIRLHMAGRNGAGYRSRRRTSSSSARERVFTTSIRCFTRLRCTKAFAGILAIAGE